MLHVQFTAQDAIMSLWDWLSDLKQNIPFNTKEYLSLIDLWAILCINVREARKYGENIPETELNISILVKSHSNLNISYAVEITLCKQEILTFHTVSITAQPLQA